MQYTTEQLKAILDKHAAWWRAEDGERANLQGANLQDANLRGADLQGANLRGADLQDANLQDANLWGANLRGANLWGANLQDANLRGADLQDANLWDANLRGADLQGANLRGADLWGADLRGANLRGADLPFFQICHGALHVWKKASGCVVSLEIPTEAKRTASYIGRKCRAEYAKVLAIFDKFGNPVDSVNGDHDKSLIYTVGETVKPDSYDDDPRVECTHGIHFFLTREEAENY